jgi:hypothetical protein
MAVSSGTPHPFDEGFRLLGGYSVDNAIATGLFSWSSGLTATGTNQATALALPQGVPLLEVAVAAASTGVMLPPAVLGAQIFLFNDGANPIQVYGNSVSGDTIDGVAGATGVPMTNAKRAIFFCFAPGKWVSAQLGVVSA